jgi:hypothetical protein
MPPIFLLSQQILNKLNACDRDNSHIDIKLVGFNELVAEISD